MGNNYKFRAWDSNHKKFVFPEYFEGDCFYIDANGVLFEYALPKSITGLETVYHKSYEHVGIFSGLKDSKGQDIYEGDIVYIAGYGNCEVEFPFLELYEAYPEGDIGEIVGNIYEDL